MTVPPSVAIVCTNNESTLGRTLDSIAGLAEQIVAVDSGSTDGTLDLLAQHGAKVIRTDWRGFVATKQLAMDECGCDWVLVLDSDESPDEQLREAIRRVIERDDERIAGHEMNRMTWYAGRPLRYVWQPEWRLRLVRRGCAEQTGIDPHDYVALVDGETRRVGRLDGTLRHDSFATIGEHLERQVRYARLSAKGQSERGHKGSVPRVVFSPVGAMFKQIVLKSGWRDGWRGWAAAGSTASATLMKHLMLLERTRSGTGESSGPNA